MNIRQLRLSIASFAAFALLAFLQTGTAAQSLTGALVGTVRDARGGVLPGAVVRITSPSLMSGEERTLSNDKGHWRFHLLPPGHYTLTVEPPPKFATYAKAGLIVGAGETVDLAVWYCSWRECPKQSPSRGTRTSTPAAADSRRDSDPTTFGRSRAAVQHVRLRESAPGVSPTSPGTVSTNSVSVFGSGTNENAFLIDGTNFTCPVQWRSAVGARRGFHPGGARAIRRGVRGVRQPPGRGHQRRHAARKRPLRVRRRRTTARPRR